MDPQRLEIDPAVNADRVLRALEDYALTLKGIKLRECFLNIRISSTLPAALYIRPFADFASGKYFLGRTIQEVINEGMAFIREIPPDTA